MKINIKNRALCTLLLLISLCGCTSTWASKTVQPSGPFQPSSTVSQDIDALLVSAKEHNRKAMIVLGANWCHDSVGLADKFDTPAMTAILDSHYETLFVDVGYLEDFRDITTRFNYPVYFATPTVLIVDPESGQLINRDSIAMWGSAASVPLADYTHYFTEQSTAEPETISDEQKKKLVPLEAFAKSQAARLQAAYAILGPMLKAYKDGREAPAFESTWQEVKGFRTQLQDDITKLRAQLLSSDASPTWPEYGPYSWED